MSQQIAAVILAAGRGTRVGGGLPKQWRVLAGRPVVEHCLDAFRAAGIDRLVLVIHPDDRDHAQTLFDAEVVYVDGGSDRGASVRAALEALAQDSPPQKVLIHDGARPLVSGDDIAGVLAGLETAPAAAPGLCVVDALWQGAEGKVVTLVPRDGLFRAQTPQGFDFDAILRAHRAHAGSAADDVEIAASAGLAIAITPGNEDNFKLTYPADFDRAENVLSQRQAEQMDFRIGNGFDVHRFGPGKGCWLCGVLVAHDRGLQGHSDADVGMHALTDAVYGALAEGDIGRHFPPGDAQWKGAASDIFLRHACARVLARGYRIGNCDVTLVCERPKIGPHAQAMQTRLAQIMECVPDRISVKATTSERLGFTGREEGIAALATVSLLRI